MNDCDCSIYRKDQDCLICANEQSCNNDNLHRVLMCKTIHITPVCSFVCSFIKQKLKESFRGLLKGKTL